MNPLDTNGFLGTPSNRPLKRRHSSQKMRAQFRHVLAVASAIFPLAATFVYLRSLFMLADDTQRTFQKLALYFVIASMVSLLLYAIALADKKTRHERAERRRLKKQYLRKQEQQANLSGGQETPANFRPKNPV